MTIPKRSNEEIVEEFRKKQTLIEPSGFLADVGEDYEAVDFNTEVMEDWLRTILTEKDAEVEKALETKAIEVREEEANEYNKIIEKEAEKARASLHASLVAAVEGKREPLPAETMTAREAKGYNQALDDTLTVINSIFKE